MAATMASRFSFRSSRFAFSRAALSLAVSSSRRRAGRALVFTSAASEAVADGGEGNAVAGADDAGNAEASSEASSDRGTISSGSFFTGVAAAEDAADEDAEGGIFSAVGGAVDASPSPWYPSSEGGASSDAPIRFAGDAAGVAAADASSPAAEVATVPEVFAAEAPTGAATVWPSLGMATGGGAHALIRCSTAFPPSFTPNRPSPLTIPPSVFASRFCLSVNKRARSAFVNPARLAMFGATRSSPFAQYCLMTSRSCASWCVRVSRSSCTSAIWSSKAVSFFNALSSKY
mmetsp:Transcript_207/g.804  ORF Transcript_207/g.804 Transcript_207/m.804 type:complete len:289 (+) Transcript_207:1247-2113(+)